ncbi:glycosyltransferase family 4 protein [Isoptericola chiayiensis]|uniref:D-inositol 3-phosphate glycosyltransferase n=2 Tax=Isoptericola chiayiensis TaxID=579446 RepID=A0ABP8Y1M7_9MICO|nr:glycosyltransferase family 4 protein [Isoptericola chiayiensis]
MRIVHAVRSDGFAGVERHVARLARAQAERGEDVLVIGGSPPDMVRELGGVLHRPASTVRDVARELQVHGRWSDVVHVHMTAAEIAAGLTVRGSRQGPAVVTTRHFAAPRGRGLQGPAVAAIARRAVSAQIAISEFVADHVDGPSTVVHPGVHTAPRGDHQQKVILILQRLEKEKETALAIRAAAASGLTELGWRVRIAGTGTERDRLGALSSELALDVEFLGHRSDVPDLMDKSGLLLAPCAVEGLGLSVLEAMARSLPVVAADAGGHAELLAGLDERALFTPGDVRDAGDRLRSLALDDRGRRAYGHAAASRQRERFTLEAQVAGTAAVYRSLR